MPTTTLADLPTELLDEIVAALKDISRIPWGSCGENKARKDIFKALKNTAPIFFSLKSVNAALFEHVHIFPTEVSVKRLKGISQHPRICRYVGKVTFHLPPLSDPALAGYGGYERCSDFDKQQFQPYRLAYAYQKRGLDSGLFAQSWRAGLAHLHNVFEVEMDATDNPDEFISVKKPASPPHGELAWDTMPRQWSHSFMRRLFPDFITPFCDDYKKSDDSMIDHRLDEVWADVPCNQTVLAALGAMEVLPNPVFERLMIRNVFDKDEVLAWSDFSSSLRKVQRLELHGAKLVPSVSGRLSNTRALLACMPDLQELSMTGHEYEHEHAERGEDEEYECPNGMLADELHLVKFSALRYIDIFHYDIDARIILGFLMLNPDIEEISLLGSLHSNSPFELACLFNFMRTHMPNLVILNLDFFQRGTAFGVFKHADESLRCRCTEPRRCLHISGMKVLKDHILQEHDHARIIPVMAQALFIGRIPEL